jgi:hypothetical protein
MYVRDNSKSSLFAHKMFLSFPSQHVSAQRDHHQAIREEYKNDGEIHIKLQRYSNFKNLLIILGRIRLNTMYTLDFKIKNKHICMKFKN